MKNLRIIFLIVSLIAIILVCAACKNNNETVPNENNEPNTTTNTNVEPEPEEQNDRDVIIKGNEEEVKKRLDKALDIYFEDAFDVRADDVKITRLKIFSPEEEETDERLADLHLMEEEIAFEVEFDVHPAPGVDPNVFTFANGEIDGDWVRNKYNCGILRLDSEEGQYRITSIGTSF